MKYTYVLENLNCAHCASKIEDKIAKADEFEKVSFNFATKLLSFHSELSNPRDKIQQICDSIENGVNIIDKNAKAKASPVKSSNTEVIFLSISIAFTIIAFTIHLTAVPNETTSFFITMGCCLISAVLAGYEVFIKGFKSIIKLQIDETTLMAVAVISAFCLGEFIEASMVTILFSVGEILEDRAVGASRRDIEKLAKIRPDTATLLVDGIEKSVSAEDVQTGSFIVIKPYERIPLDGIVISGKSTIDMSALTGESMPVDVCQGSEVLSGSVNGNGLIKIKTSKKFGDSTATRILKLVEEASAQKGKNEKLVSRFASIYTPIVVAIAIIIAIVPPLCGFGDFSQWVYRALVCLVASCPCAIVISVPLSYYSGIGAASKIGVLIKGGKYIEALAKSDTFVFDKTGTITTGKLRVDTVISTSEFSENEILRLSAACEKYSVHPVAVAIKEKAGRTDIPILSDYHEIAGYGTSALYNGKKIECGGAKILTEKQKEKVKNNSTVFLVYDSKLIGCISLCDTIRDEARNVIKALNAYKIKNTVVLTGDSKGSAQNICNEVGITSFKAELLPEDKLNCIVKLKENSDGVCFVGDGINDAPVLTASDCGIAMGFGSEAAIEASDAVLASGTLSQLPKAVKISRSVMNTIRANIIFALSFKAMVIILAFFGIATMWMSVIADTGVSVLCVLNAARLLRKH